MKLQHPIYNFSWKKNISQMFGVNYEVYYSNFGIPGHNGLDYFLPDAPKQGYGQPIYAAHDGYVQQIISDNATHTKGNGIYLSTNDADYISIYWHLSVFSVNPGQQVKTGDKLGEMGNTGFVFPKPTAQNPYAGTHLHFGLQKVDAQNEYKGIIDPLPFFFNLNEKLPVSFNRNLFPMCQGDDVSWLQSVLKLEIPEIDFEPIGYFGNKTRNAVIKMQAKNGINPTLGFVGQKTREFLNYKYS